MIGVEKTYDLTNVEGNNTYFIRNKKGQVLAVHNCGFGTGAKKFRDFAKQMGVILSEDDSQMVVQTFRQSHPAITQFWKKCDWVLGQMVAGGQGWFYTVESYRVFDSLMATGCIIMGCVSVRKKCLMVQ